MDHNLVLERAWSTRPFKIHFKVIFNSNPGLEIVSRVLGLATAVFKHSVRACAPTPLRPKLKPLEILHGFQMVLTSCKDAVTCLADTCESLHSLRWQPAGTQGGAAGGSASYLRYLRDNWNKNDHKDNLS